ncbi:MAG TPA: flavin reductase family protein [Caulobacteraceae bacterium]
MSVDFTMTGDHEGDARALRDAFGCFTTGVTIVTTLTARGAPAGFTANSFASVSLDPPLVLVCVDLKANTLPALEASKVFVVNVLHAGQRDTARKFARRDADKFKATPFETWATGAPVLSGCMANFECETHQAFDAGDHRVFIGRVLKLHTDPDHDPLVFLRGGYCGVTPG